MIPALHVIMIAASASSLCCVLGSRGARSVTAVGGTVLMAAAMADLALGLVGLAPLAWTVILLGWAMVAAAASRRRWGRSLMQTPAQMQMQMQMQMQAQARGHGQGQTRGHVHLSGQPQGRPQRSSALRPGDVAHVTTAGAEASSGAGRRHLHLVHQLGLVVVAGQIALCAGMAGGSGPVPGANSAPGAGAGMTHPHSASIFVAVVCVAGALFVVAAAVMVLRGRRSGPERGTLLSMSVMTAAMAVMPFG